MSKEVASPALVPLVDAALDPLFWRPERLGVDSAWFGHVPFAHWIVGAHRPASIVELGTHNGVSFTAFCEAVLRGRLDCRALAVDTWRGDEHAGFYDDDIYTSLKHFNDGRYAAFSTLLRSTFDEALAFVPDGSIDLLHIDGRHRYADVSHDFATWRPKLSARAVVLFHDTNVLDGDFGVWRLWAELRSPGNHFEFLHGHGLGVLAVGESATGTVAELCALQDGGAVNALRERFALLGDRWIATRDLQDQAREAERLRSELSCVTLDLAGTRKWAQTAQDEVNRLFPAHRALTERHRETRATLAQLRFEVDSRDLQLADLTARLDTELAGRLTELAAHAAELSALQAELNVVAGNLDEARAHAVTLRERVATLEHERSLLRSSTSWRITAPIRGISGRVRGQRPTVPSMLALAAPVTPPPPVGKASAAAFVGPVSLADIPIVSDTLVVSEIGGIAPPIEGVASSAQNGRPRALFISGESHTPGHVYRVEHMVTAAQQAGFDARWTEPEPVGPAELAGVALVVLWRVPFSSHIEGIVTVTHEQGGIAVFDVDDLMFRPELATIETIDGIRSQKFSASDTQAFFERMSRTLQACDFVCCPTEELAHQARRRGRPAYVLPNGFDDDGHAVARDAQRRWTAEPDDLLRIGYAGGSRTHQRDFAVALPAIIRVLNEVPQARLTLFRDPSSGEGLVLMDEFPEFAALADRIEWRDMVPLAALPRELARFSVNIAPLQRDNPFCEAKSELKFFEAALAGVSTIASPSGPFLRAIDHGITGFLAATDDEWHAALRALLDDAARRARVAQAAYHVSLARFGPQRRADAFALMAAQMSGGLAGAAAFERERYRAALPRAAAPHVPDFDITFNADRFGRAAVTVIVPVFNYADYVPEALASVAAQTLPCIDLVIVDDGSPDDSAAMVLDWVRANAYRFNRIVFARHRANAGLGFARNTGFALAETPFVLPLDADNRLRPKACENLLAGLEESTAAFAYPLIQQFGDKREVFGRNAYSVMRLRIGNTIDAMALVRKSAWAAAGGYDHVQYGWEDFDLWCRLAENGFYGVSVPEILADYRVHGQSMLQTTTEIRENRIKLAADLARRHPWLDLA